MRIGGHTSKRKKRLYRPAGRDARRPRRLPHARRAGGRSLRREGRQPAQPSALLLCLPVRPRAQDPQHGRPRRRLRLHRDRDGHGGRHPRVQPHQAAQAALQRPAEGRQELPVHQDRLLGRLPADIHHAARHQGRLALLRPLRQRLQRTPHPGAPEEALPLQVLHQDDNRQRPTPLPRLLHTPLRRAVHRRGGQPPVRRRDRPGDHVPGGQGRQGRKVHRRPHVRGRRGPGVRARRGPPRPAQGNRERPRGPEGAPPHQ